MTYHSAVAITLGAVLLTLAGCKDSSPFEPSVPPPTTPGFPPLSQPAIIFDRTSSPSDIIGLKSRYVLYEDGTFSLQFVNDAFHPEAFYEYPGRYSRADSAIAFVFDGGLGLGGPWLADGIVNGDSLAVQYNSHMLDFGDFENGVYVQPGGGSPAPPPPLASFPPLSRPGIIYDRISPSVIPGNERYVLYEDGTFGLQYVTPGFGFFEYSGKYSRADSAIAFTFDANNPTWLADGVVAGDSLVVQYNHDMVMSDFEDGLYVRPTGGSQIVTGR